MQQIMRLVDFVCSFTALISVIFSLYVFFIYLLFYILYFYQPNYRLLLLDLHRLLDYYLQSSTTCLWKVEVSALVLRIWNIFAQMLVFAVVGFSKSKSLYLNVTGDKYTHLIHIRWQRNVSYIRHNF